MELRSLHDIKPEQLYLAFSEAFKDYELQLDREGLDRMLKRRGFDPQLSLGAFEKEQLVAFTFNGTGLFQNTRTAYDTGTGTIEAFRGRGLAREIFQHSIPFLAKAGIQQYLLEVLQHNDKAVKLYAKLGFEISREFYYYIQDKSELRFRLRDLDPAYTMEPTSISRLIETADFSEILPSWQNSRESIRRGINDLKAIALLLSGSMAGYCIFEPLSGDITDLAVAREHRGKHLGKHLLASAIQEISAPEIKVINIPTDAEGINVFLRSCNLQPSGKQYEMIRKV